MKNRFRNTYRTLTDEESTDIEAIKNAAEKMEALIDKRGPAVALTHLEIAVMFAVKEITR